LSSFRTLFKNATLVDGTGAPGKRTHVLVQDDEILGIGALEAADEIVDCEGLVLAPGFIDVHTHDDALALELAPLDVAHPKLSQGVCTVVTGNCGVSLAPLCADALPAPLDILPKSAYRFSSFAEYFAALDEGSACNVTSLVGHTSLRAKHVSCLDRAANEAEKAAMAHEVQAALDAGALGLSTGVYYPPARAADLAELCAVAAPLGKVQAVLTMHLRSEADDIDDALREAFAVSRAANCALVLSHHKVIGLPNHGRADETLAMIDEAARTQSVCLDCYPYTASSTMLIPERVAQSSDVLITWCEKEPALAGRSLFELARERGVDPRALAQSLLPAGAIYFAMAESDV
jgi:N-acyl-D-amino-acid deacylase